MIREAFNFAKRETSHPVKGKDADCFLQVVRHEPGAIGVREFMKASMKVHEIYTLVTINFLLREDRGSNIERPRPVPTELVFGWLKISAAPGGAEDAFASAPSHARASSRGAPDPRAAREDLLVGRIVKLQGGPHVV